MEDDWNLYAVVRGCAAATTSTIATDYCSQDIHLPYSFQSQEEHSLFPSDPFEPRHSRSMDDLHDLVKPFFPKIQRPISLQNTPISPLSVLGFHDLSPSPLPKQKQEKPKQNHSSVAGGGTISTSDTTTRRSKRRKKQLKRVCQVPAEGLSCDTWCWRKYGQKPIKGSPFPRGYYKCSTSKMCFARKQVERSRPDPGMFFVTYTGEHNHPMPTHRNTLAGIPRQKSVAPDTVTAGDSSKPPSSPPVSPLSEKTETSEDLLMEDEDDELGGVSDTPIGDDFFEGLEELRGDCFCDQFPVTFTFPWGPHCVSTTAAGSAP